LHYLHLFNDSFSTALVVHCKSWNYELQTQERVCVCVCLCSLKQLRKTIKNTLRITSLQAQYKTQNLCCQVYVIIEALADGAVRMGLPREQANRLAAQTVLGAGSMVLTNKIHPTQLKDNVTSPAGNSVTDTYSHLT